MPEKLQELLNKIPTGTDELFEFPIDWEVCDEQDFVDKKLKVWVGKKAEKMVINDDNDKSTLLLTGEDQRERFVDIVVRSLKNHEKPRGIVNLLLMEFSSKMEKENEEYNFVEECLVDFVKKMWQMLALLILKAKTNSKN
jgi:hypothetical protein